MHLSKTKRPGQPDTRRSWNWHSVLRTTLINGGLISCAVGAYTIALMSLSRYMLAYSYNDLDFLTAVVTGTVGYCFHHGRTIHALLHRTPNSGHPDPAAID